MVGVVTNHIGAGISGLGFSLVFPALGVEAVHLIPASSQGAAFGMAYIFPFSVAVVLAGLILAILLYYRTQKSECSI